MQILSGLKAFMKNGRAWIGLPGKRWIWLQARNHYFQFSKESLKSILQFAGFEVKYINSRKPNNRLTKKMYHLTNRIFSGNFGIRTGITPYLKRKYEDLTGVELFAVAVRK